MSVTDSASTPVTLSQNYSGAVQPVGVGLLLDCNASSGSFTGGTAITPTSCKVSGGIPPYQWFITNGTLPAGLQLAPVTAGMAVSGVPTIAGKYSYSIAVADNGGQSAQWPFTATIANPVPYPSLYVFPHMTFGADWQTRFVMMSSLSTSNPMMGIQFYGDSGNPIGVPYTQSVTGNSATASFVQGTIPPNGVMFVDTTAAASDPLTTGSAQVEGTDFGIFSYPAFNWQALVPIDTTSDTGYIVAFDNTGSLSTGVALTNGTSTPVVVTAVVNDDSGNPLQTATLSLVSNQHTSFMLNQQFPASANKRGTVRFTTVVGGSIHVLAIRANGPALTTLPVIPASAYVAGSAGSVAHVTYNGGFISTFYLVNPGTLSASFTINFYNESGGPLTVPLMLPQSGTTTTSNTLTKTLAPGAMLIIQTQSNSALPSVSGSAQVSSNNAVNVNGFEIFDWTTYGQEASVPMRSVGYYNSQRLVFDNTGGYTTGAALSNPTSNSGTFTVNIRDEKGNLLQTSSITLPGGRTHILHAPSQLPCHKRHPRID